MNGSFQIARSSLESEVWRNKPAAWWKIWCYILACVQHSDYKELKRGQGRFNFKEAVRSKDIGEDITYPQVDHFMRWAKQANMLATTKATHGMIVTVANYGKYQDFKTYRSDNKSEELGEVKAKQERNESDNINNNANNANNVNKSTKVEKAKPSQDNSDITISDDGINPLISLFKSVNPSYKRLYSNTTQRKALQRMIDEHSYQKIESAIKALIQTSGEKYAPVITTPLQLEEKLGVLIQFLRKEKSNRGIAVNPAIGIDL